MTVSYQYQVASSTSGGFTRLLFMWRGSLYKLIYRELCLFLVMFGAVSAVYRRVLSTEQKKSFEQIVVYCEAFISLIPLSFVLGFYVAYVASRWWQQYKAIPWPDKVMHSVALYVIGNDEYGRMLRRALMRYLNLSLILVLRSISSAVKRRFPTLDHVVDSGFMTSLELELFVSVPSIEFNTYWIPCTWFINLLKEARTHQRLPDPQGLKIIMEEFNDFRSKCGMLWSYDWVSIPLVYTQVVTLATYSFFAVALIGRQYIEGTDKALQMKIDIYFPIFTVLQFFFFMGLLKVAEQLINPFGDDDEDFELNWMIDRHTKVSYLGVDTLMNRCPPLVKDIYYDSENLILPYTEAAAAYKRKTYRGSVAHMTVPEEKQTMFLPNIIEEEENITASVTPRNSSASLGLHDSPSAANRRQGESSPEVGRRVAHGSGETVVTMDTEIDRDNVITEKTAIPGGRQSAFSEAVKMFSTRGRTLSELTRKPFFALAKSSKVNIQPWPSATNLKSYPVTGTVWNEKDPDQESTTTSKFNIPSIDVRQTSLDYDYDDYDDVAKDESNDEATKSTSPQLTRAGLNHEAAGSTKRGYLNRAACIEDSLTSEPCCSGTEPCTSPSPRASFRSRSIRKRTKARLPTTRFHSFPKFLARRHRVVTRRPTVETSSTTTTIVTSSPLTTSKSSPELRLAVEFEASDRVRAKFFTGDDDDYENRKISS